MARGYKIKSEHGGGGGTLTKTDERVLTKRKVDAFLKNQSGVSADSIVKMQTFVEEINKRKTAGATANKIKLTEQQDRQIQLLYEILQSEIISYKDKIDFANIVLDDIPASNIEPLLDLFINEKKFRDPKRYIQNEVTVDELLSNNKDSKYYNLFTAMQTYLNDIPGMISLSSRIDKNRKPEIQAMFLLLKRAMLSGQISDLGKLLLINQILENSNYSNFFDKELHIIAKSSKPAANLLKEIANFRELYEKELAEAAKDTPPSSPETEQRRKEGIREAEVELARKTQAKKSPELGRKKRRAERELETAKQAQDKAYKAYSDAYYVAMASISKIQAVNQAIEKANSNKSDIPAELTPGVLIEPIDDINANLKKLGVVAALAKPESYDASAYSSKIETYSLPELDEELSRPEVEKEPSSPDLQDETKRLQRQTATMQEKTRKYQQATATLHRKIGTMQGNLVQPPLKKYQKETQKLKEQLGAHSTVIKNFKKDNKTAISERVTQQFDTLKEILDMQRSTAIGSKIGFLLSSDERKSLMDNPDEVATHAQRITAENKERGFKDSKFCKWFGWFKDSREERANKRKAAKDALKVNHAYAEKQEQLEAARKEVTGSGTDSGSSTGTVMSTPPHNVAAALKNLKNLYEKSSTTTKAANSAIDAVKAGLDAIAMLNALQTNTETAISTFSPKGYDPHSAIQESYEQAKEYLKVDESLASSETEVEVDLDMLEDMEREMTAITERVKATTLEASQQQPAKMPGTLFNHSGSAGTSSPKKVEPSTHVNKLYSTFVQHHMAVVKSNGKRLADSIEGKTRAEQMREIVKELFAINDPSDADTETQKNVLEALEYFKKQPGFEAYKIFARDISSYQSESKPHPSTSGYGVEADSNRHAQEASAKKAKTGYEPGRKKG